MHAHTQTLQYLPLDDLTMTTEASNRKALSHIHMCTWGPSHHTDSNTGPQNPTTPTSLYSFSLYSFLSISFSFDAHCSFICGVTCIFLHVCNIHLEQVKIERRREGERGQMVSRKKKNNQLGLERRRGVRAS